MYRLIFISFLLLCVLSIGLPFSNPLADLSFRPLRLFGLDVSMTPLTSDMSMMSDRNNVPIYSTKLHIFLHLKNNQIIKVSPHELNLYLHKIPLILYFEIIGFGGSMPEGRVFLCRSFERLIGKKISYFKVFAENNYDRIGFSEDQECSF